MATDRRGYTPLARDPSPAIVVLPMTDGALSSLSRSVGGLLGGYGQSTRTRLLNRTGGQDEVGRQLRTVSTSGIAATLFREHATGMRVAKGGQGHIKKNRRVFVHAFSALLSHTARA